MRFKKSIVGGLAMLPLVGLLTLTGTSGVMAAPAEETLAATGTAAEHFAAAQYYQTEAQAAAADAAGFRAAVAKIGRYDDPKGFRRGAFTMAAQKKEADAKEMQELYATHLQQANALHGQVQPQ